MINKSRSIEIINEIYDLANNEIETTVKDKIMKKCKELKSEILSS